MTLIGRVKEKQDLKEIYSAKQSAFVAVYGRRRMGKTFLILETFDQQFDFYFHRYRKRKSVRAAGKFLQRHQ
jgi:hypothetical protein